MHLCRASVLRPVRLNSFAMQRNLAPPNSHGGYTVVDLLIVLALVGVLTALAIPQFVSQRRLLRSSAMIREIVTQIRYARQQALSQRQVFTVQYDDATKTISIIDHNNDPESSGIAVLTASGYPNTAGSAVVSRVQLTQGGLPASEIRYGIPTGLPTGALSDGVTRTNLSSGKINISFQPDGSILDTNSNPQDRALFFFNSQATQHTAAAVSVLGAAGRVKLWRYDSSVNRYVE